MGPLRWCAAACTLSPFCRYEMSAEVPLRDIDGRTVTDLRAVGPYRSKGGWSATKVRRFYHDGLSRLRRCGSTEGVPRCPPTAGALTCLPFGLEGVLDTVGPVLDEPVDHVQASAPHSSVALPVEA